MVTLILSIIAVIISLLTFWINLQSKAADIVVYLEPDPDAKEYFICLHVTNVGQTTARDIKFSFNKPLPFQALDIFKDKERKPNSNITLLKNGFLIEGLSHLAPNRIRTINLGGFATLNKYFEDEDLICTVQYTVKTPLKFSSDVTDKFTLSIKDWSCDPLGDNSNLKRISDTLQKIETHLKKIADKN